MISITSNMANDKGYTFVIPVQCTKEYDMLTGVIQLDATDYYEGYTDASQLYEIYTQRAMEFRDRFRGDELYLPSFHSFRHMIENQAEMIPRMRGA